MPERDAASLGDMLRCATKAVEFVDGETFSSFQHNELLRLAVERLVELIGEAASRVSSATRERVGTIPWRDIVGMRNRLIHGYDAVNLHLLWDTVQTDLPPLIEALRAETGEI